MPARRSIGMSSLIACLVLALGCGGTPHDEPRALPAPERWVPVEAAPPDIAPRPLLRIDVTLQKGRRVRSRDAAATGQQLARSLEQLPDCVVRLAGSSPPPGLAFAHDADLRPMTMTARLDGGLSARICDASGECTDVAASAPADTQIAAIVERLVAFARLDPPAPQAQPIAALADSAVTWLRAGDGQRLVQLGADQPELRQDPRLALLLAIAPCYRGKPDPACLAALPPRFAQRHQVLGELAALAPEPEALEAHVRWARAAPSPAPALKARDLAIQAGRYQQAQELDELAQRLGADPSPRALALAIDVAGGRWEQAATHARARATRQELAWKAAQLATQEPPPPVRGESPALTAARARHALDSGQTRAALAQAERLLGSDPWNADAWAIKTRALAELGRMAEASRALTQLERVDPLSSEATMVRRLLGG